MYSQKLPYWYLEITYETLSNIYNGKTQDIYKINAKIR